MKYYLINYSLDVIPLGEHDDFDSADEVAQSLDDGRLGSGILYVACEDSIEHLKNQLLSLKE